MGLLIIGERINSTRESIQSAIKARDAVRMLKEAKAQLEAGANFIDVNCAVTSGDEIKDIEWVIDAIQGALKGVSICVDSPDHLAIERALKVYNAGGRLMINSITAEESRIERILPLAIKYKAKLVALTMDASGMPNTAEERRDIAGRILERLKREGFDAANLYFDPLIRPVSTEPNQAGEFLRSIPLIKALGPVKTICGLSNVSFGLPDRKAINSVFLSMAVYAGLDAAILDPTDRMMTTSLRSTEALLGLDEYCAGYIRAFREGKLA